ncbi:trypsin-like peptidase domain-containing protein [uncultured Phycicoccus sp.]|uniref:trypsin-like peptidase domain-containing protein n=1 Tax=uncultured Phycicoccus sp. TaxID=661422 RepID=UPI002623963C|nr:trypsin-like peptidase domain-containing protein [uncultured Phycicoccus sp.]
MHEQQPTPTGENSPGTTPQWYTPHGGTATTERPTAPGSPAAPPHDHPSTPGAPTPPTAPPPVSGPFGPSGPSGPQGSPPSGSGRRRTAEITAVAVLAAVLSSGGTLAATRLWDDAQTPSAAQSSSTQLGRGTDQAPVQQADAANPDWAATAAAVSPSVVAISAESPQGAGQGSGVIIDDQGHVVTNNHVVAGAQKLTVTLNDGRAYPAEIRGTDPSTDLAVITITDGPSDLTPVAFGDSDALEVGDPVMAVGNPLGLAGTVTTGIVSALNRPVTTEAEQPGPRNSSTQQAEPVVTNAIQTSAAINPGNSGGALVNASGQLVGINSSIASLGTASGGQAGSIGIGFAIPVTEVRSIATQLIETGTAVHAYLGVVPQTGTASDGSATRAGAEIRSVEQDTPAAAAGLEPGDVVIAVNGEPVDSAESLVGVVREQTVGSTVTLTVLRDGTRLELSATLTERSSTTG